MDKRLIISKIEKHYNFSSGAEFARFLGITPQNLSNWKTRNTYDAELIYTKCLDLNPEWLLTGYGEMLKIDAEMRSGKKNNIIPFYEDVETVGGHNYVAEMNGGNHYGETIDAGEWFPEVTAAIRHYNDSMVEYPSGCILAVKKINDLESLVWGMNYVIETSEMRITKRLQTSDDDNYIMAYSTNRETYPDGKQIHEPKRILKTDINNVFLVLGRIVKEHSSGPLYANNNSKKGK